jgi:hypothetical protein
MGIRIWMTTINYTTIIGHCLTAGYHVKELCYVTKCIISLDVLYYAEIPIQSYFTHSNTITWLLILSRTCGKSTVLQGRLRSPVNIPDSIPWVTSLQKE